MKKESFSWVCREGNLDKVERYLQEEHNDFNLKLQFGDATVFSEACYNGKIKLVKLLMKYPKIDINLADGQLFTPLHHACSQNHVEIVRLLLDDPRTKPYQMNSFDHTPFSLACHFGSIQVVQLMLDHDRIDPIEHPAPKTLLKISSQHVLKRKKVVIQMLLESKYPFTIENGKIIQVNMELGDDPQVPGDVKEENPPFF